MHNSHQRTQLLIVRHCGKPIPHIAWGALCYVPCPRKGLRVTALGTRVAVQLGGMAPAVVLAVRTMRSRMADAGAEREPSDSVTP